MPASIVKSFAKKTGKSTKEIEKLWRKAKKIALSSRKVSDVDYYALVVNVLKRMIKIK